MKKIIALLLIGYSTIAKDAPKYPVGTIPEPLLKDVSAVYRVDDMVFHIHSKSKATLFVHKVVTILNANAKNEAREVIGYDKLSKVNFFKASVYNGAGELIKRLKSSEIYDQSAFDGFSLYSDNRLKAADLTQGAYPYTVEFEYEIEYKYLFQIPSYRVGIDEKTSLEKGKYQLIYPTALTPRYTTTKVSTEPQIGTIEPGIESTTWSFENLLPLVVEPLSPHSSQLVPHIDAAPLAFSYEGYEGRMETWDELGKWITSLNEGRNQLPEATKRKILELTQSQSTPEQKVKAVYEYLQSKTRYVSIQLGIGGFQPFEASVVDETGYGDCKALSNYLVSMLDVAGIKAHYVLINAGDNSASMNTGFASSQFNHAVACVPLAKDTVWLECTSQTNPFGYMGRFTGNRKALAITDSGAVVVNTPAYTEHTNTQSRTAKVILQPDGNATAKVQTTYAGLQYENDGLNFVLSDQFDKQKEWVQDNTDIPNFDIRNFSIVNNKDRIPSAVVSLDLALSRLASVSGKRLFLTPNLMNRSTFIPEKVENRKNNVFRKLAYTDYDTIRFEVPESIYPEFLPKAIHIESVFGSYDASYTLDEHGLLYVRKMVMKRGEFPAATYNQLIDFYKSVNKADNTKIVFLTKT